MASRRVSQGGNTGPDALQDDRRHGVVNGETIIRPCRTGTRSGSRVASCSSNNPTGSGRSLAVAHPVWLDRGVQLRASLPCAWRSSTSNQAPSHHPDEVKPPRARRSRGEADQPLKVLHGAANSPPLVGLCQVGARARPRWQSQRGAGRLQRGQAPAQQASRACSSPRSSHNGRPTPPFRAAQPLQGEIAVGDRDQGDVVVPAAEAAALEVVQPKSWSQRRGTNSRQSNGQLACSVTALTDTPNCQLAVLPSVPEYWRSTPTEHSPSLGSRCHPPPTPSAPRRPPGVQPGGGGAGRQSHGETATKWCSAW